MGFGSLFSSKSKSSSKTTNTTTNTYTDNSQTTSGTIGDMSKGNLIAGQDAIMYGYSAEDTQDIINSVLDSVMSTVEGIKDTTGKAINQVQSAYSGANLAILESQNETKATLNSLKPYAFYAMIAAIAYFVWGKRR